MFLCIFLQNLLRQPENHIKMFPEVFRETFSKSPLRILEENPVEILQNFFPEIVPIHSQIFLKGSLREFNRSFYFGNSCRSTSFENSCGSFPEIVQGNPPGIPPEIPSGILKDVHQRFFVELLWEIFLFFFLKFLLQWGFL